MKPKPLFSYPKAPTLPTPHTPQTKTIKQTQTKQIALLYISLPEVKAAVAATRKFCLPLPGLPQYNLFNFHYFVRPSLSCVRVPCFAYALI